MARMSAQRDHHTKHERGGKDWTASSLATKIKQIFSRQRIKSPIILKQNEENVEEGKTQGEIEKEEEDGSDK